VADRPLLIAILWHQHQPEYFDPSTGVRHLPWVRMHALKSYLSMAERLLRHEVKVTINLTPSLLRGLEEYLRGGVDEFLVHARKPVGELTAHERWFILDNFFRISRRVVESFPRYRELSDLARAALNSPDPLGAAARFPGSDLQDLRVWFDLAWFHHSERRPGTLVGELTAKGRGFTAADHEALIACQLDVIARVVPAHGRAFAAGRAELSTSPLYHPILPLLIDTDVAAKASPGLPLPRRFAHPDDALNQVRLGLEAFERVVGVRPQGLWPSEGAVSSATAKLAAACGVRWLGSDEGVLAASLEGFDRDAVYHAYEHAGVGLLFRDRGLSDLIGFEYHRWPDPSAAARDLVARLRSVRSAHPEAEVVPVFLDGENAWEHYPVDGDSFLDTLYAELAAAPDLATVSVAEALARLPRRELGELAAGSWIGANFETWIGEEEENRAWEYLGKTRDDLAAATAALSPAARAAAWDALYTAQGSDYFWWFGDDQDSGRDEEYCRDFRAHLARVYSALGRPAPPFLAEPVVRPRIAGGLPPRNPISPVINGRVDSPYEWLGAGRVMAAPAGPMARGAGAGAEIFYGWDGDRLYLRVDADGPVTVDLDLPGPGRVRLEFGGAGGVDERLPGLVVARESVLELALPRAGVGLETGGDVGVIIETAAGSARVGLKVPGPE
jgi:alpha-amylase/alpha-mannosidase (GH57 family)